MQHSLITACLFLFFSMTYSASNKICPACNTKFSHDSITLAHINNDCPAIKGHEEARREETLLDRNRSLSGARNFLEILDEHLKNKKKDRKPDFAQKAHKGLYYIIKNPKFTNELKAQARKLYIELISQYKKSNNTRNKYTNV